MAKSSQIVELAGLGGLIEKAVLPDCRDGAQILWQTITSANPQVAAALNLPEGSTIIKILWMLRSSGTPASLCSSCFPADLWARCVGRDVGDRSSYLLLQQRLGPQVKAARQMIDCCRAPKWVASLLQIEPKTAVIACEREVFLEDGTAAEYATAYARGDLLKFAFERRRQEQEHGAVMDVAATTQARIHLVSGLTVQSLTGID